jgi:hypothetical protein
MAYFRAVYETRSRMVPLTIEKSLHGTIDMPGRQIVQSKAFSP